MIIKEMRASFGKLHDTLTLREGMQVLCLPNEAGKSTWSAFLLAMLYGVDTSERATRSNHNLPMKERYRPWDGSPMEGSIDILWQGRAITIERTTTGRIPMGAFRAYDTQSGSPIPELTGENCGLLLCGVERSVFERTALIRQLSLPVTEDQALEKRLSAMVTTGEEGPSALELDARLRVLRNKISGRTGRINRISAKIERLRSIQNETADLHENSKELQNQLQAVTAEIDELERKAVRIQQARVAQRRTLRKDLQEQFKEQKSRLSAMEQKAAAYPDADTLQKMHAELMDAQNALDQARLEIPVDTVDAPSPPQCFEGLTGPQALQQVEQDLAACKPTQMTGYLLLLISSVLLLLAVGAVLVLSRFQMVELPLWYAFSFGIMGVFLLAFALIIRKNYRPNKKARKNHELLLSRYGVEDEEQLLRMAEAYARRWEEYTAALTDVEAQDRKHSEAIAACQTQVDKTMEAIRTSFPHCATPTQGLAAVQEALSLREQCRTERRVLEQLFDRLRGMTESGSTMSTEEPEAFTPDVGSISAELQAARKKREALREQLAHHQGSLSAKGDTAASEAELERLNEELEQARHTDAALSLAAEVLHKADEELRAKFSPRITAEAGKILSELTDGVHSRLLLSPTMELSLRQDTALRPAAAMSCGTGDQMYLALRLAMCRELLPKDAPMILDDALLTFDEKRTAAALELLSGEGKQRQIIVFTCRPLQ